MKMKSLRRLFLALACCSFVGVCLNGCSHDVKVEGDGGKGLSAEEKKAKRGDQ